MNAWLLHTANVFARRMTGRMISIDSNIPTSYIVSEMFLRACMCLRGMLLFSSFKAQISWSAKIRCRQKIRLAGRVSVDDGVVLNALSRDGIIVGNGVSIGKLCVIECTGSLTSLGKGLVLGDRVGIGSKSFLGCAGGVTIGTDTIFGNYVSLHSENHVYTDLTQPIRNQGVTRSGIIIGSGCWIGAKATILDGACIGNHTVVAAGATVISGNYPDNVILGGTPARILKHISSS